MKESRRKSEGQRECEAQFYRSDILLGPPSRVEFNGQDLLPTVGTALIVVAANACYVQVELACNTLERLRLLFTSILDWRRQGLSGD